MRRLLIVFAAVAALSLVAVAPASAQYIGVTPPNVASSDAGLRGPSAEIVGAGSSQAQRAPGRSLAVTGSSQAQRAPVRSLAVTGADLALLTLYALISIAVGAVVVRRSRPGTRRTVQRL